MYTNNIKFNSKSQNAKNLSYTPDLTVQTGGNSPLDASSGQNQKCKNLNKSNMKPLFTRFLLCLAFVILYSHSDAASYYFSTTGGDDSRTAAQARNPSTPWKTINKLNAVFPGLQPGDAILFKRGETFYGSIHISKSGSQGAPIVFSAYGTGSKPVITSLVSLKNWVHVGNGVYESHQPSFGASINVVLLNNTIQEMGRYPNSDSPNKGYLTIESTNRSSSVTNSKLSSSPNWTGGEVAIRKSFFTIDRHPVTSHSGSTVNYGYVSGTYNPNKDFGFFIQGHIRTLDKLGEWYYNPSSKKLSVFFGSNNPGSFEVQASTIDHLFTNVKDAGHLVFDNLHLKGANRNAFNLNHSQNVTIKNVDIDFSGEDAVFIHNLPYLTIENSKITNSLNNGLSIMQNTAYAKLVNNKIENTNLLQGMGRSGVGNGYAVHATSDNNLIEYNEIKNTAYIGIRFGGNHTVVKNNFIDTFCITKDDGAGIYTWTGSSNQDFVGRKITGNIVLNGIGAHEGTPSAKPQAEGIYLDDNSSGVEVIGNTVANVSSKGIFVHNARNIVIRENRFVNNGTQLHMGHDNLGYPIRNATITDNVFFASQAGQLASYVGSVKDDIKEMGNLDRNYYARPADDVLTILTQNFIAGGTRTNTYDLDGWKKAHGKDPASKRSPVKIPAFQIVNMDNSNQYAHGTYSASNTVTTGIHGSNSNISWSAGGKLDGGALQVKSNGNSSVTIKAGSLRKSKHYVLRFSAVSSKNAILKVLLMQSNSPYAVLGEKVTVELKTGRSEYEVIIPITSDESAASMRFEATDSDLTYWLDNVALHEAEAEAVDPKDYIRFEYNPTRETKNVSLDGTYVDMKNVSYSGSVSLAPYSSKVLIRTSKFTGTPAVPAAPTVNITSPIHLTDFPASSDIEIKADAADKDGSITKVEFFHNNQVIATFSSAPCTFVWQDVPAGEYAITARATDNTSLSTTSAPVTIKVDNPVSVVTDLLTAPDNAFSLYLNTGSNDSPGYGGVAFLGDNAFPSYYNTNSTFINVGASPDKMFQTERNGENLGYSIPVPNGTYTVKTYHNELWFGKSGPAAAAGRRVFDISLEGKTVKDNFDIFAASSNRQTVLTFENIEVRDGRLDLDLAASSNRATISGIAILGGSAPAGTDGPKEPVSPTVSHELYLNTGSAASIRMDGKEFTGDRDFKSYYNTSHENTNTAASSEPLYQTERNAQTLKYSIPVPNGTYTVKTYHNELYFGKSGPAASAGRRVFNISLEGRSVKGNFDIFAENGNRPTVLTFENIEVKDGTLNLDMVASRDRATVSGIAITGGSEMPEEILPAPNSHAVYLNAGSSDGLNVGSLLFEGDREFKSYYNTSHENTNLSASSDPLYQTERNAQTLKYSIPVPNGTYTVKTYHNELWFGKSGPSASAGRRVFNISLEGKVVKGSFDIFIENANRPTVLTFENIEVKDGTLNLDMVASKDRATVSGIAITGSPASSANLRIQPTEKTGNQAEKEAAAETETRLYPNPAKEAVTVSMDGDVKLNHILIHNMGGQLMHQLDPLLLRTDHGKYQIPLDGLPQGIYLVSLVGETEMVDQLRLIVRQ